MARAWAAAQRDTAFVTLSLSKGEAAALGLPVTLSLSKGEAAATRVTPVTLSLSKGEAAATRVTPVTLSLSKGEAGSNSGYPRHPEPVEG
jgi:hypothetical protein